MAHQLHYASIAKGLTGRAGFQFTARSAGAPADAEPLIERFMTYRPPAGVTSLDACPMSLAYQASPYGGILVCCRYLGEDYTGRPGNFLGHAVVAVPEELDGLRPIELWRAPFWAGRPGTGTLPPLTLDPGVAVDPDRVSTLLAAAGDPGYALLAAVLDATRDSLAGQSGSVTLVGDDVEQVALWIGAVAYSLPIGVARGMSFVTYTADPRIAGHHLVGTTPQAWARSRSDSVAYHVSPVRPTPAIAPSPYAIAAVAAWRTGDLAEIDTLCAIAAVACKAPAVSGRGPDLGHAAARGGGLDAAAALLSLCRGEPVEERYSGPALRLLELLPDHDRARLLDRTAASLAGADGRTVTALLDGDSGDQLADLLVDRDWSAAPQVGRLVYAQHGRRHSDRRTEMAGRLADLAQPATGPGPDGDAPDRPGPGIGSDELAETIGELWIDADPSVGECVALLERLDRATADNAAVRDIVARALSGADLADETTLHLARTVVSRYPAGDAATEQWPYDSPFDRAAPPRFADRAAPAGHAAAAPERLAAGARVVLAAASIVDGCAERAAPERLAEWADRLAWWYPYADSPLATAALRRGAAALAGLPVADRITTLKHAAETTRRLVPADWLSHPDEPAARTDLAEIAVRLRGCDIAVPPLQDYLVALARRPLAFRRLHRSLQGRATGLGDELRALVDEAGGGWRAVFRRPAGS
jgi:hypothetical protein